MIFDSLTIAFCSCNCDEVALTHAVFAYFRGSGRMVTTLAPREPYHVIVSATNTDETLRNPSKITQKSDHDCGTITKTTANKKSHGKRGFDRIRKRELVRVYFTLANEPGKLLR